MNFSKRTHGMLIPSNIERILAHYLCNIELYQQRSNETLIFCKQEKFICKLIMYDGI